MDIDNQKKWQQGMTINELLMAFLIGSLVIAAIATLMAFALQLPRREREQGRITDEARRVMDRVSDEMRGSQSIDWNGNGRIDDYYRQEYWLLSGDRYSAEFYTHDDQLGETVKIRYFLDGTDFKRQVTRLGGSASACEQTPEQPTIVASGIRNGEQDKNIFCYLPENAIGTCCLRMPVDLPSMIERIRLSFIVDNDPQQEPGSAVVQTAIRPRGGMLDWPLDGSVAACADCVDNDGDGQADHDGGGTGLPADVSCRDASDQEEIEAVGPECDDGLDNEGDFLTDFRADGSGDPQCLNPTSPEEDGTACSDTYDNDSDSKVDFGATSDNDPGCENALDTDEHGTNACDDGLDNDGDGRIDFGTGPINDPGCADALDDNERGTNACDDGLDNDTDGGTDYPGDPQCANPTGLSES